MKRINALTIAGTDPSGGAGIQADLKTFSALGAYGCSVITALVAQNTRGVQSVYRIEPDFVAAQLDSVFSDVRIDTTKIGMLAETDIVEAVAERLARYQIANVVLDTVIPPGNCDTAPAPAAARFTDHPEFAGGRGAARCAACAKRARDAGTGQGAVGARLRGGINEGRTSGRRRKPGLAVYPRRRTALYRAARADQKYPRYRLYVICRAGGAASSLCRLGTNRRRSEGLAIGGAGAGRFAGSGARYRPGTSFPRLVVNGSETRQQNLLKKRAPGWKIC